MFKANAKDPELAEFDALRRSLSYSSGFSYTRYKSGLNVAIAKKANNFWINKTRNILCLEADQNFNYKKLSRDVMHNAERRGTLAPHNFGRRKHHRAIEVSLNHRLTCDLLRQKRKVAILASTDAKGCFDRIVHSVTYICLRQLGLPSNPIQAMLNAIQQMTHYIRTAFGDSSLTYGYNEAEPILMGLLQGNGAAGTGWQGVASMVVSMMKSEGFGLQAWGPISKAVLDLISFQYVDDATIAHSGPSNDTTGETILASMQEVIDHWEGALRTSGGAIAHDKSYWHLVDFKWNGTRWVYRKVAEIPGTLTVTGPDGTPVDIECQEVTQSKEMLGLMGRPDGVESDEAAHLRSKTLAWSDSIRERQGMHGTP